MGKVKEFFEEKKAERKDKAYKDYLEKLGKLEERAAYHQEIEEKGWGEDKPIWTSEDGVTDKEALLAVLAEFTVPETETTETTPDKLEQNVVKAVADADKVSEVLLPILESNKSIKDVNFDGSYISFKNGAVERKYFVDNGKMMGKGLVSILFEGMDSRDNQKKTFFVPVDKKYEAIIKKGFDGQLTYDDVKDIQEYLPDLSLYYMFDLSEVDMTRFPNREAVIGFSNVLYLIREDVEKRVLMKPRFRLVETEIGYEAVSDEKVSTFTGSNTTYYSGMKYSVNDQGVWFIMNNQAQKIISFTASPQEKENLENPMILKRA